MAERYNKASSLPWLHQTNATADNLADPNRLRFATLFLAEFFRGVASQSCQSCGRVSGGWLGQQRRINDSQIGHTSNTKVVINDASHGAGSRGVIKRL